MKSEITFNHGDFIDTTSDFISEGATIIEEWEGFTGRSTIFNLMSAKQGYLLYESDPVEGKPAPYLELNSKGKVHTFYYGDDKEEVGPIKSPSDMKKLSKDLGVVDILKPLPHEYGILKLKYGMDRDWLFFPSMFRGKGVV